MPRRQPDRAVFAHFEGFRVAADADSWEVQRLEGTRSPRKALPEGRQGGANASKEENWVGIAWYPSLSSLVIGEHDRLMRLSGAKSLAELAERGREIAERLERVFGVARLADRRHLEDHLGADWHET